MGDHSLEDADTARWRRAVEQGVFGVWDLEPRLETVHYSPEWKARLGFPRLHEADHTGFWRCRVHPADVEPMLRALRAHVDGHAASYEARFRLRSNGGGYRQVLSRGRVVARDARGEALRMVGTMVDLTDRPPVAAAHGLATELPGPATPQPGRPFHAELGVAVPGSPPGPAPAPADAMPADGAPRLIELVDDLLETALRDGLRLTRR